MISREIVPSRLEGKIVYCHRYRADTQEGFYEADHKQLFHAADL